MPDLSLTLDSRWDGDLHQIERVFASGHNVVGLIADSEVGKTIFSYQLAMRRQEEGDIGLVTHGPTILTPSVRDEEAQQTDRNGIPFSGRQNLVELRDWSLSTVSEGAIHSPLIAIDEATLLSPGEEDVATVELLQELASLQADFVLIGHHGGECYKKIARWAEPINRSTEGKFPVLTPTRNNEETPLVWLSRDGRIAEAPQI